MHLFKVKFKVSMLTTSRHSWSLIIKMKVTCMTIIRFIFSLFALNAFLFSSLVLAGFQKIHISGYKGGQNLLKNILLKLNFQHEGYLYSNCLFYILTIYRKCLLFQFLSCSIRMDISIPEEVQNGCITGWKMVTFAKKCTFWSLFS